MALEWIRENIAAFGGDPDNVTLAGQSSGAHSALAIASVQAARQRASFQRLMLLSPPLGMAVPDAEEACSVLPADLRANPASVLEGLSREAIIELQAASVSARQRWGTVDWPFQLCVDEELLTSDPFADLGWLDSARTPVLLSWTADEGATHFAEDESVQELTVEQISQRLRNVSGERSVAFEQEAARRPEEAPIRVLAEMIGHGMYTGQITSLLERRRAIGRCTRAIVFAVESEAYGGRLHAGHATDLPYVFGNYRDWKAAPSLVGIGEVEFRTLSRHLRTRLADFMHDSIDDFYSARGESSHDRGSWQSTVSELTRSGWAAPLAPRLQPSCSDTSKSQDCSGSAGRL